MVEARKYVEKGTSYHAARLATTANTKAIETCQFYGEICNYT